MDQVFTFWYRVNRLVRRVFRNTAFLLEFGQEGIAPLSFLGNSGVLFGKVFLQSFKVIVRACEYFRHYTGLGNRHFAGWSRLHGFLGVAQTVVDHRGVPEGHFAGVAVLCVRGKADCGCK